MYVYLKETIKVLTCDIHAKTKEDIQYSSIFRAIQRLEKVPPIRLLKKERRSAHTYNRDNSHYLHVMKYTYSSTKYTVHLLKVNIQFEQNLKHTYVSTYVRTICIRA